MVPTRQVTLAHALTRPPMSLTGRETFPISETSAPRGVLGNVRAQIGARRLDAAAAAAEDAVSARPDQEAEDDQDDPKNHLVREQEDDADDDERTAMSQRSVADTGTSQ